VHFDILENPFVVLNVSPRATREELVTARENAVWDLGVDETDAGRALSSLLHPRERLLAEISFLPSASPAQCKAITAALKKGELPDVSGLSALDQANLHAHALSVGKADPDTIDVLSRLHQKIDVSEVIRELNAIRQLSRERSVERADALLALTTLVQRHAQVAAKVVVDDALKHSHDYQSAESIWAAERLVTEDVDGKSPFVAQFIEAYGGLTRPELQRLSDRIDSAAATLRKRPSETMAQQIADDLHQWDALRQPVQLWDQSHGIDEPESQALGKKLRELCVFLANDKQSFDVALTITKAMNEAFGELEGFSEKLEEDVEALEELLEGQRIKQVIGPLQNEVEAAQAKLDATAAAISRGALTSQSNKNIRRLVEQFKLAADKLIGTPQAGAPALILRSLALSLHNEGEHSQAALTLTNWVLANAPQLPGDVRTKLEEDRASLERMVKRAALLSAARSRQLGQVEALAAELAATADDDKERAQMSAIAASAQKRRASDRVKYWIWGGIAAVVLLFVIADENSSGSNNYSYEPTYAGDDEAAFDPAEDDEAAFDPAEDAAVDAAAATDAAAAETDSAFGSNLPQAEYGGAERVPSIGTGEVLDLAEIRYCRRQDARLTSASRMVDTSSQSQVDGFNAAVSEYNLRCSNFRYYERDMAIVERELMADASQLAREGIEMVDGWR
jgi:hypothetical protein